MVQVENQSRQHATKTKLTVYSCQPDEASLFLRYAGRYGVELSLNDQPVSLQNVALADGSQCISISHTVPITVSILNALHDAGVRYISTRSIGCDHIDLEHAAKIGICVGNVSYSPDSVADYTLMLMLMASRCVKSILRHTEVQNYELQGMCGRDIHSLTVGVVGTGRIGCTVIQRLRGFGCRILAYDLYPNANLVPSVSYVDFTALLAQSDILTLHMPATEDTHHIINSRSLARMKNDAVLINTSRGSLVDSCALIDAIEAGRLGGAALDVIEDEAGLYYRDWQDRPIPNRALALLNAFPNVIITPHTAFYTDRAVEGMVENSIKNCLLFASAETGSTLIPKGLKTYRNDSEGGLILCGN